MKVTFFIRLLGCFVFGSLYALFVCVINSSGMRILVSPMLLAIFPAMVMGSLFYSLIGGDKYIFRGVGLSYRVLAIYIIGVGFVLFGLDPDLFHSNSMQVVFGSAVFGLGIGYLMSDWHVFLYKAIFSKKLIGLSAGIFLLSYYIMYNLFFPYSNKILVFTGNADMLFLYCCICVIILLAIIFIDQIFLKAKKETKSEIIIKDFTVIRKPLILVFLLSFQISLINIMCWSWYLHESYLNAWLFSGDNGGFFQLIFLPSLPTFTVFFMLIYTWFHDDIIFFVMQGILFISCFILVLLLLFGLNSILLCNILFLTIVCSGLGLALTLRYYVIISFKGSIIAIFVPISICITLFFTSMREVLVPVLPSFDLITLRWIVLICLFVSLITSVIVSYYAKNQMNFK